MRVTVLGCGGSGGVPQIDSGWGRCDPDDPRNRRLRSSILIEMPVSLGEGSVSILVDASPDLRQQLLEAQVRQIDAVLFTHAHADHIHGLDDLRPINRAMEGPIPIYADAAVLTTLKKRFGYAFLGIEEGQAVYRPWLVPHEVGDEAFCVRMQCIMPLRQDHGWSESLGYRFGDFAYSTDLVRLPEETLERLRGVKVWIVGCFSDRPHPTHAHVSLVLDWVKRVAPQRTFLTHMGADLDYARLKSALPPSVEPAYDGLQIAV